MDRAVTIEQNKALVRRFIDEVFVGGSFAAVDELLADELRPQLALQRRRQGRPQGGDRARLEGLADPDWVIEDLIAEGDRVVARVTASAHHVGPFMGLPPTDKTYSIGEPASSASPTARSLSTGTSSTGSR